MSTTSTYTSWTNSGSPDITNAWAPGASSQTSNFTQTRGLRYPQERYEQKREKDSIGGSIRNTGSPVRHTRANWQEESRTVTVSWGSWSDNGGIYSCGGYSPATSTVDGGKTFTQTRSCKQNQKRNRYYKVGSSTILTQSESRTINENNTRSATGTKDYITGAAYRASATTWANNGNVYNCGSYSPSASTQTSNFTQTRSCKRNQKRTVTYYDKWWSGKETIRRSEEQTRVVNNTPSRTVTVSAGSASSSANNPSWSPAAGNQTSNYSQFRTVRTTTTRTYSFSIGGSHTKTTYSDSDQGRNVTISKSGWINNGGIYGCGSWSHQSLTTNSATRTCKQNQKYTYTHKVGSSTIHTRTITRTNNVTQSASASGTLKNTDYQGWANYGSVENCSPWMRDRTGNTASRMCDQPQRARYTVNSLYSNGVYYPIRYEYKTQTIRVEETKSLLN